MLDKARSKAHGNIEAGFARRLKREVATHRALSGNPFVCKLWGVYEDDKALYIVTELCTGELWPPGCCWVVEMEGVSMHCNHNIVWVGLPD